MLVEEVQRMMSQDEVDDWFDELQVHVWWRFDDAQGINEGVRIGCQDPIDFFQLFLNDELVSLIVDETNRYVGSKDPM